MQLHLTCVHDATQALCHPENGCRPGNDRSPDLTSCDPNCPNVVYPDSDIAAMGEEVRGLRDMAEAPDTSPPRKVHYNQRAERLKGIIAKHGRSRTALQQGEPARFTGAQRLNACAPIRK